MEEVRELFAGKKMFGTTMFHALLHAMFKEEHVKLILALACANLDLCQRCPMDENECEQRKLADEFNALADFLGVEVIVRRAGEDDPTNERAD